MEDILRSRPDILSALDELYREVDEAALGLRSTHAGRIRCVKGCAECCMDGITVFEVEAGFIMRHAGSVIETAEPHPEGACAFLDGQGACRIYPYRPYVCRTQGLPLRWIDKTGDSTFVEMRDICPLNEAGTPVETLPGDQCWPIGPFEAKLAALQALASRGVPARVSLRSLFSRTEEISIGAFTEEDERTVLGLLADAGLPTQDLDKERLGTFLVARNGAGSIVAAVGCETFGEHGLLRSLVVHPDSRGLGIGRALARAMEGQAFSKGVRSLYLLTTTAPGFFLRLGYEPTARDAVPACIAATEEFRHICPASAACLKKGFGQD